MDVFRPTGMHHCRISCHWIIQGMLFTHTYQLVLYIIFTRKHLGMYEQSHRPCCRSASINIHINLSRSLTVISSLNRLNLIGMTNHCNSRKIKLSLSPGSVTKGRKSLTWWCNQIDKMTWEYICIFCHSMRLIWYAGNSTTTVKNLSTVYRRSRGYRWLGGARSQGLLIMVLSYFSWIGPISVPDGLNVSWISAH